ncbi:hypothetical protein BDR04DRAFT_1097205 [Suillus decipiens]|nr:hypothetical protein BDR04DRAFT_1097205 [Suillus decipiens]
MTNFVDGDRPSDGIVSNSLQIARSFLLISPPLTIRTFETLGKARVSLRYHVHLKNATDGKPTRRSHTTELPGIDTEVAK